MSDDKDEKKKKDESKETDTLTASLVRDTLGDEVAETFKLFFGNWF